MATERRYDQRDFDALIASKIPGTLAENPAMRFDSAEEASAFFAQELDYVKSQSYDVKYPKMTALAIFPVSSEVDEGAETVTYYGYDMAGMAKIISNYATDLPRVDVKGKPTTAIIKSIGDSYGYSVQEMRASRMAGKSLDARKAKTARYAADYLINKIAWCGDKETGLRGVLSPENDIPIFIPANGAAGDTSWEKKTSDEILSDFTAMLTQMSQTTMGVETADTIAIPESRYITLQNKRIEGTDTTLLAYIRKNIIDITTIERCPELEANAVEFNPYASKTKGEGKAVAILFKNDKDKFSIENPMPFRQYPAQVQGLETVIDCEARTAGVMIYYPLSLLIAVGI